MDRSVTAAWESALHHRRVVVLGGLLIGAGALLGIWLSLASPVKAGSIWTFGQLLVLIIAATVAADQVYEARQLREATTRPYVVIDIDPWSRKQLFLLTIENLGATMAYDVQISFEPKLQSTLDDPPGVTRDDWPDRADFKIFTDGIPNLAPKKRLVCILDGVQQLLASELPKRYVATVTYRGLRGSFGPEEFVLDLEMYTALPTKISDE